MTTAQARLHLCTGVHDTRHVRHRAAEGLFDGRVEASLRAVQAQEAVRLETEVGDDESGPERGGDAPAVPSSPRAAARRELALQQGPGRLTHRAGREQAQRAVGQQVNLEAAAELA